MENTKVCYKKDSKGKIRLTAMKVEEDVIIMASGLVDGKLVETVVKCKPKNVGKSNETTANQQAILEMESRFKAKLDEGYFESVQDALDQKVILPMLAKEAKLEDIVYPIITSPKLDGMRALHNYKDSKSSFISRKGKKIETVDHIKVNQYTDYYFDGELYAHGKDFQTNMKMIKKYTPGQTEEIKFHIYDVHTPDKELTYTERYKIISALKGVENVEIVPYVEVYNEEELLQKHKEYLELGYEGSMLRINEVKYELNKRSNSLLKFKDFKDEVFEVVDVVPNEKSTSQGTIVCKLGESTFKCGMKMSHKDRELLLQNKDDVIGKYAEVRYFETSNTGVPRFPVCHGIREDK